MQNFKAVRKHSFRIKWILVDFLLNMLYVFRVELDLVSVYIIFLGCNFVQSQYHVVQRIFSIKDFASCCKFEALNLYFSTMGYFNKTSDCVSLNTTRVLWI